MKNYKVTKTVLLVLIFFLIVVLSVTVPEIYNEDADKSRENIEKLRKKYENNLENDLTNPICDVY
jgi:sensor domain CHASE-containing protein